MRRVRKARAIKDSPKTFVIQFIPGGYYRCSEDHDWLYSGVHALATTQNVMDKLWPLAAKAMQHPNEWTTL